MIICPMLKHNETYKSRKLFKTDPEIIPTEQGNRLYDWVEKIGNLLAGSKTLFLIDDITAHETLNKRRQCQALREGNLCLTWLYQKA